MIPAKSFLEQEINRFNKTQERKVWIYKILLILLALLIFLMLVRMVHEFNREDRKDSEMHLENILA